MNTTLEKLKERIKDKKYKLTTQRQTILQASSMLKKIT